MRRKKPELLIPASCLEVLKVAVAFGADAVYIGGEVFGLRAKAKNFSRNDMEEGVRYAHEHGVRVHVTVNILAHNYDLEPVRRYLEELRDLKPDALIIADPGIFMLAGQICPDIERHISTQANNTNYATALFWQAQGARRIVTARELSLDEIREMRARLPEDMEIETFIHGAMCISYSGRCLLSSYFTGRDANRGACTHPCRWRFLPVGVDRLMLPGSEEGPEEADACGSCGGHGGLPGMPEDGGAEKFAYIQEETRPGQYLPVYENERGTYIFNSKDLCMIEHIPELVEAGIDSFKIEGRMKTALYVATVARTYRRAIDDYLEDPGLYEKNLPWYREQIAGCTYRQFTEGFFFGRPDEKDQIYDSNTYTTGYVYLGTVDHLDAEGRAVIEQKNKFSVGDCMEIMQPEGANPRVRVAEIRDSEGNLMESAPHPRQELHILLESLDGGLDRIRPFDILRRQA